jgi:hypothetical protein
MEKKKILYSLVWSLERLTTLPQPFRIHNNNTRHASQRSAPRRVSFFIADIALHDGVE